MLFTQSGGGAVIRLGILNVTGYAGAELARILHGHPQVKVIAATGRSGAGKALGQVFPHLAQWDITVAQEIADEVDVVFSALPHGASAQALVPFLESGVLVIDLSADFRLRDPQEYAQWYGGEHPAPHYLGQGVYGLPEIYRERLKGAHLVANPGCYPTGALLALAPALKEGLITPDIIVDAKSGVSGAGRTVDLRYHFSEVNESVSAYGLGGHRHLPEMVQEISALLVEGGRPRVTFVPHLVPMTRGILTTCYAPLRPGGLPSGEAGRRAVRDLYEQFYQGEPFVRICSEPPSTKHVQGSNMCLVYPTVDASGERLIVVSAIDNLVKGAAGQAVQNMNILLGLPETMGLEIPPLFP